MRLLSVYVALACRLNNSPALALGHGLPFSDSSDGKISRRDGNHSATERIGSWLPLAYLCLTTPRASIEGKLS